MRLNCIFYGRKRTPRKTPHLCPPRFVAQDEGVWLRAMDETERDRRKGWMENGCLSFDHVPMIGIIFGRERFRDA